ncbi:hypothetical protein M23134_08117 [Microscilla marina ATCC 23134]|uniref:Uncharacterized protein n=1 Tax=Microscilla marina ATCC 23134 TaxID=313606 RepID=A1ZH24_MICM2|nr:hypothetical protein M23134_08117 [Microscilla marina ATCC 23134]
MCIGLSGVFKIGGQFRYFFGLDYQHFKQMPYFKAIVLGKTVIFCL